MKVAIIQEWLVSVGGSDKVVKAILDIFPDADIYTLVADKNVCLELGINFDNVKTSFIQKLPFGKKKHRMYLPIFPYAIEQFDLRGYDVIISSSHAVAKGVLTKADQLHICYCHSPIRYAWDMTNEYLDESNLKSGFKSILARYILHRIRQWDVLSSMRVDHFISNSNYVGSRIWKTYRRESRTIYPNIDISNFTPCYDKQDFYLTSSRLVPYKKIDIIVEAFNNMPEKTLYVIGGGPDLDKIKKVAKKNVVVLGYQAFEVLKNKMQKAKAFIFAADEDFGMIPIEAQACATPVIAYCKGGSLETVVNNETGIYFNEQTSLSIIDAVCRFEMIVNRLDYKAIRKHAEKFSEERFKNEFREFVEEKYINFKNKA